MEYTQKLAIAKEVIDLIVAAKNGITIADTVALIEKVADVATKFAEPRQIGGMWLTSLEDVQNDIEANRRDLIETLKSFDLKVDVKHRLDDLLSFKFELNEVPLSHFFRFMSEDTDNKKIDRVKEVCEHFPALKIGYARNIPKFDQTLIDAGAC